MGIFTKEKKEQAATKGMAKIVRALREIPAGRAYSTIIKPLVTEKGAVMQSGNKYSFIVATKATKAEIKAAVKKLYQVEAVAVNTINVSGHAVRYGRNNGRHSDFKKAIVTLKAGESIALHEGV